jgi:hypothetical protein
MACRHEQIIDGGLGCAGFAAALFADGMIRADSLVYVRQDVRADQAVRDDHVGALQPAKRLDGQQFGISRPGADEMTFPGVGYAIWKVGSCCL